ncbi:MAG: hypothetical protein ABI222_08790, partial [Opitutaceae bacterium]
MRPSSFRLALPLALLAVTLPSTRLSAADPSSAAPADSSAKAPATAETSAKETPPPSDSSAEAAETA